MGDGAGEGSISASAVPDCGSPLPSVAWRTGLNWIPANWPPRPLPVTIPEPTQLPQAFRSRSEIYPPPPLPRFLLLFLEATGPCTVPHAAQRWLNQYHHCSCSLSGGLVLTNAVWRERTFRASGCGSRYRHRAGLLPALAMV